MHLLVRKTILVIWVFHLNSVFKKLMSALFKVKKSILKTIFGLILATKNVSLKNLFDLPDQLPKWLWPLFYRCLA